MKESQIRTGNKNRVYNKPQTLLESKKIGFTTTDYWVENQQLLPRNKRYITTNSVKRARKIGLTTTGYWVEAQNTAGDRKNYCRLLGNSFIYSTRKHKKQLTNSQFGIDPKRQTESKHVLMRI